MDQIEEKRNDPETQTLGESIVDLLTAYVNSGKVLDIDDEVTGVH